MIRSDKKFWMNELTNYTPAHRVGAILQSSCPSIRSHFRNRYLSFYWKKWFYIWYMALAWWLVPCLPFPGLPHTYFLFTVRLTNEWVGVFLAWRSVQPLVYFDFTDMSAYSWSISLTRDTLYENSSF